MIIRIVFAIVQHEDIQILMGSVKAAVHDAYADAVEFLLIFPGGQNVRGFHPPVAVAGIFLVPGCAAVAIGIGPGIAGNGVIFRTGGNDIVDHDVLYLVILQKPLPQLFQLFLGSGFHLHLELVYAGHDAHDLAVDTLDDLGDTRVVGIGGEENQDHVVDIADAFVFVLVYDVRFLRGVGAHCPVIFCRGVLSAGECADAQKNPKDQRQKKHQRNGNTQCIKAT